MSGVEVQSAVDIAESRVKEAGGRYVFFVLALANVILIGRPQDFIPGLGAIRPGYVLFALLLVLFLSRYGTSPSTRRRFDIVSKFTYFFMLLMFCSIVFAEFTRASFFFLLQFMTIPVYFYCLCRETTTRTDLRKQIWVVTLIVLFLAVLAAGKQNVVERVQVGDMYDPNDLALLMVVSLPMMFFLFQSESKALKKGVLIVTILLSLITVVMTKSRGGLLGLVVTGIAILFMKTKISESRFNFRKLGAVILLSIIFLSFGSEDYWARMKTTFVGEDKGSGRTEVWKRAVEMMEEKPITGVGVRNFTPAYGFRLRSGEFTNMPVGDEWAAYGWATAHNSFLLVGAELGLPGLILYVGMLGGCLVTCVKLRRNALMESDAFVFSAAGHLLASLMGFITCSMFLSFAYQSYQFYLVAVIVSLSTVARVKEANP